jgi:hypothetical protein
MFNFDLAEKVVDKYNKLDTKSKKREVLIGGLIPVQEIFFRHRRFDIINEKISYLMEKKPDTDLDNISVEHVDSYK